MVGKFFNNVLDRVGIAGDLIRFFWQRKFWWLIPLIIFLLILALLLIFAQGAAVTPFIYPIF